MKRKNSLILTLASCTILSSVVLQANQDESEAEVIYAQEIQESTGVKNTKVKKTKKNKQKTAGWYMRTKVSATASNGTVYRHDSAGIFGKLKQSKKGKDKHDIAGYGAAILQVVFPHYNWGDDSGDYFSDYKRWNKKRENKRAVWTFLVRNQHTVNLANAPISIELEGAQNVDFVKKNGKVTYIETTMDTEKKNLFTLVDVDNGKTYSYNELATANLNMDGSHKRTFRWVLGKVRKKDFKPLPDPQ